MNVENLKRTFSVSFFFLFGIRHYFITTISKLKNVYQQKGRTRSGKKPRFQQGLQSGIYESSFSENAAPCTSREEYLRLVNSISFEVDYLLSKNDHKKHESRSYITFGEIRYAKDPKDALNRLTRILIARVAHLTDEMTGVLILPLKDFKKLLIPANEGNFKMILPYEELVLRLLNSKTFVSPNSLFEEIHTDIATLLNENGDSTGVEEVPITIDDTVVTQATKKPRTETNTNP